MGENIRSTNLRFNLDKETQNRAWQYLQTMDKHRFKSYSNVISIALVDYFDRYYRSQDDPYLETREREERFVDQIVASFWLGAWPDCLSRLLSSHRQPSRSWRKIWTGISLENDRLTE